MNPAHDIKLISEYNHSLLPIHYILYNLFRILRPIRLKHKLSINELIYLTGIYCYTRHQGTSFSFNSIHTYISYFTRPKSLYYVKSLKDKGYLYVCDIVKGKDHYKITQAGLSLCGEYEESYLRAINKFYNDNNISL